MLLRLLPTDVRTFVTDIHFLVMTEVIDDPHSHVTFLFSLSFRLRGKVVLANRLLREMFTAKPCQAHLPKLDVT